MRTDAVNVVFVLKVFSSCNFWRIVLMLNVDTITVKWPFQFLPSSVASVVTFDYLNDYFSIPQYRSSQRRCSRKKAVLKSFPVFTEKDLCGSLFLVKLQAFRPAAVLKRDSNTDVFLGIFRNF